MICSASRNGVVGGLAGGERYPEPGAKAASAAPPIAAEPKARPAFRAVRLLGLSNGLSGFGVDGTVAREGVGMNGFPKCWAPDCTDRAVLLAFVWRRKRSSEDRGIARSCRG